MQKRLLMLKMLIAAFFLGALPQVSARTYMIGGNFPLATTDETDMHELLQTVIDSIYDKNKVYTVGTEPGCVPAEAKSKYDEIFSAVLDVNDKKDLEQSVYAKAIADLRQACELINASVIRLSNGWYFIRSGYPEFYAQTGTYRDMYSGTDGLLHWATANDSLPTQYFIITQLEDGNYLIQNAYDKKYINFGTGNARTTAGIKIAMSDKPIAEQIFTFLGDGLFYIGNSENPLPYHPLNYDSGTGVEGLVAPASAYESASNWMFVAADSVKYASIVAEYDKKVKADELTDELGPALAKVVEIKSPAPASGLITSAAQLSDNCGWSNWKDWSKTLDGDHNSHFHSTPDMSVFKDDEYVQVDLNRSDITSFIVEYWGRNDGAASNTAWHDSPTKFIVKATNTPDDETSWTEITTLDKGFPGNVHNAHYVSLPVTTSTPYRYYRFIVKNTTSGNYYWNVSEFQLYDKVTPSPTAPYASVAEAKKLLAELDADIATATDHINNIAVDGTEISTINAKLAQLEKILDDQQVVRDAVAEATDLNEKLFVKNDDGSYDPVASQYIRVEGMKDAADKMVAAKNAVQEKLDAGIATIADTTELKAAIASVLALYQDTTELNKLLAKAEVVAEYAEIGYEPGFVPDEELLADLESAIAAAKENKLASSTAVLNEKTQALADAYEALENAVPSVEEGKWYYILSADDANDVAPANLYPARTVNGAALYVLNNGNSVFGSLLGRYDDGFQMRWGLDDWKGLGREGDAEAMWHFVAAPDSFGKRVYYIQNLLSGLYIGPAYPYSYDYYVRQTFEPYPYRIDYVGAGEFNIVPVTGSRAGVALSFGNNARQVRADDIPFGVDNRASFNFKEIEDVSQLNLKFVGNAIHSYTFPFAVSGLEVNGEKVKAYGIHSLIDPSHVGLVQKNSFAAGEPMLLFLGDPTASATDTADVTINMPSTDFASKPDTVNGLVGSFYAAVLNSPGLGYLSFNKLYATSNAPIRLMTYCNYIVNSLITDMDGEPDAVLTVADGGVLNKVARVETKANVNAVVNVYTINGVLVKRNVKAAKATTGLKRGIYIVGKRKVMVR